MLPKKNRLKKRKDFETVFEKGTSFKGPLLILKIAKNNLNHTRFGFVVSQKVAKKAVTRNKIKRRLSEIIRAELKNFKNGIDVVIISLAGIEKKSLNEIKSALKKTLNKSKILNV